MPRVAQRGVRRESSLVTLLAVTVPAFALIGVTTRVGLAPPRSYGVLFVSVFAWIGLHHPKTTFSAGVALHGGGDVAATLARADAALYQAKRAGRDRCVSEAAMHAPTG